MDRLTCPRCRMTFVIAEPPRKKTERGRCAEPGCGRVHWTANIAGAATVRVGVWPEKETRE